MKQTKYNKFVWLVGIPVLVLGLILLENREDNNNVAVAKKVTNTILLPQASPAALPATEGAVLYTLKELNLNNKRQVHIFGPIDDTTNVVRQILELGKSEEPMTIVLNSPGGSVFDGAMVISAMQAAKGPVNTLCVSLCASMAAMIHQYGTNRLMLDRSMLMFHQASGGLRGEVEKMDSRLQAIKEYILEMENQVAVRSKQSVSSYKAKIANELWINARRALSERYADQIVYIRGPDALRVFKGIHEAEERNKIKRTPLEAPSPASPDTAQPAEPTPYTVKPDIFWILE